MIISMMSDEVITYNAKGTTFRKEQGPSQIPSKLIIYVYFTLISQPPRLRYFLPYQSTHSSIY